MINLKNLNRWAMVVILIMILPSCQKDFQQSLEPVETHLDAPIVVLKEGLCDVTTQLFAGQHIDVGEVYVTHDLENIYVTYYTSTPGWVIKETHMHVADELIGIPMTKNGNPKVGHFEYSGTHDNVTEVTYEVPIVWGPDTEVVIAAHAVVKLEGEQQKNSAKGGDEGGTETAWAAGLPFPGNNWATYFYYTICFENGGGIGTESEDAYAYAPQSNISSPCFPVINIPNDWGWQIGPFQGSYTFELWSLPETCDHSTGFHVGYVEVLYKSGGKMDVSYRTFLGYSLEHAHLYVSDEPWPSGVEVVPDDFPYNAWNLGGVMFYTFSNLNHKDDIFIIAYAKVYGVIHIG